MVSSGLQSDPSGFPDPALPSHPSKNLGSKKNKMSVAVMTNSRHGYPQTNGWRHGGFILGYKSLSTKDAVESLVHVSPVRGFAASYVMYCYNYLSALFMDVQCWWLNKLIHVHPQITIVDTYIRIISMQTEFLHQHKQTDCQMLFCLVSI